LARRAFTGRSRATALWQPAPLSRSRPQARAALIISYRESGKTTGYYAQRESEGIVEAWIVNPVAAALRAQQKRALEAARVKK
jgi:hypothetical protein